MTTCLAIRHVAFEDLGNLAPVLESHGFDIRYVEAGYDDLADLDPLAPELVVVLGGPIGAYEEDAYPFLMDELRLIEARLKADRPLVGICLGAQLMARALGAKVYPNGGVKEIGWSRLDLAKDAGWLEPLADVEVLHWHGDTFDLPPGSIHLASTAVTRNQAFRWGRAALGLQFHIEATGRGLERWFIGHAAEISSVTGLSVAGLRADTARFAGGLEGAGGRVLKLYLSQVMLP
jgi:GMP synthase (glutamine-hydrolysing)